MNVRHTKNIIVTSSKQICDLKLYFCHFHFAFDLTIGVIDDCQEHVKQDEENDENEDDKEEWS